MGFASFLLWDGIASLLLAQLGDDPLGLSPGTPLAIQTCTKRCDDRNEILDQVFFPIFHLVDDLDPPSLHGQ